VRSIGSMDQLRVRAETHGFFTRTEALTAGHDDQSIRRAIRVGAWRRVRAGAYTCPDLWPQDPRLQHLVVAYAALAKLGERVALSHTSAAVAHGLSLWDPDLSRVHVTRTDGGAGRTEAGVVHHEGLLLPSDLVRVGARAMTAPVRAALEAASLTSAEGAVVILDSLLHLELADRAALDECYAYMQSWPEFRALRIPVLLADGRAESVGESRARYLFFRHGLPAPQPQFEVRDERGRLVGTTDFGWPEHRLLGEFDGRVKYERYLRDGETPGDAVFREKKREDRLCEITGWRMVRLVWSDLYDGPGTAARVGHLLGRTA